LSIIAELKAALREHVERIRNIVAATDFDNAKNRLRLERRSKQQEFREIRLVPPQETSEKNWKFGQTVSTKAGNGIGMVCHSDGLTCNTLAIDHTFGAVTAPETCEVRVLASLVEDSVSAS
jgi:hypothetical protein